MEIEITNKKNNPFFKRDEVHFTITHENQGTPNQAIIRNELAQALNVKKDQIIIDTIESHYGIQQTKGYAKVYNSRKSADSIERKHLLHRNKVSEAKPKKKEEVSEETQEPPQKPPSDEKPEESAEQPAPEDTKEEKEADEKKEES